ncbi:MAG: hypothetical protein SFW36_10480 [Leptolyngbyaceae cyanobacterium bins.59]|nr:hypothetical protein [Leptolyngbyaceae cyanobacterium bins.59]
MMIKVRLQGSLEEVNAVTQILKDALEVLDETENHPSPDEVSVVKRYLTVKQAGEQVKIEYDRHGW